MVLPVVLKVPDWAHHDAGKLGIHRQVRMRVRNVPNDGHLAL